MKMGPKKNSINQARTNHRLVAEKVSLSTHQRRKVNKPLRFARYIFKVLNQIHPTLSLTNKAMKVMDDFMLDVFTRLVSEAASLVKFSKKATLSASEFQTATKLILPGELSKHAVSEATKAVSNFMKSKAFDAKRNRALNALSSLETEADVSADSGNSSTTDPVEIEIFAAEPAGQSSDRDEDQGPAPKKKIRLGKGNDSSEEENEENTESQDRAADSEVETEPEMIAEPTPSVSQATSSIPPTPPADEEQPVPVQGRMKETVTTIKETTSTGTVPCSELLNSTKDSGFGEVTESPSTSNEDETCRASISVKSTKVTNSTTTKTLTRLCKEKMSECESGQSKASKNLNGNCEV